ncbi:MAG: radical SAM protein, partial [Firmicutes bacterium]|nr:radical SAM protein [Bacillota bacterium]
RLSVYVLCNYNSTFNEDLYRIETLKALGYAPYVMIYNKPEAPPVTRQLQRWVNNRRIFNVVDSFADYKSSLKK